jgi:hypothetical protein
MISGRLIFRRIDVGYRLLDRSLRSMVWIRGLRANARRYAVGMCAGSRNRDGALKRLLIVVKVRRVVQADVIFS